MKFSTPAKILSIFLKAFNNQKMHVKNSNNKYDKTNYWDQECLEHPTSNSCLIYCD